MNILPTLKQALEALDNPGYQRVVKALDALRAAIEQIEKAEPAAFAVQLAEDGSLSWNTIWEERWAANDHLNSLIQEGLHTGECHVLPLYTSPPDAQAEIERLKKRLEIDDEAAGWDGIACRDETIKLQDEKIERLTKDNNALREMTERWDHAAYANAEELVVLRQQLAEREGWQLVPKVPTKEMLDEQDHLLMRGISRGHRELWFAMLAAAPKLGDSE